MAQIWSIVNFVCHFQHFAKLSKRPWITFQGHQWLCWVSVTVDEIRGSELSTKHHNSEWALTAM